jgi:hypothetical protein
MEQNLNWSQLNKIDWRPLSNNVVYIESDYPIWPKPTALQSLKHTFEYIYLYINNPMYLLPLYISRDNHTKTRDFDVDSTTFTTKCKKTKCKNFAKVVPYVEKDDLPKSYCDMV